MKIEIDTQELTKDQAYSIIDYIYNYNSSKNIDKNQKTITNPNDSDSEPKKVLCQTCQKDLYSLYEAEEAKKVINYSNNKIGKILCRDCQKEYWQNRGNAK